MADLLPTLLDTTSLQCCIFLGFATSFLRFPSHVSAFSLRLVRGSFVVFVHIFVCCGFFSFFRVSCSGFYRGLSSAFFLRSFFSVLSFFLRFFRVSCDFLRFSFAIALYENENV